MFGLRISFVKSILYKIIITKFFWDYCLNSQVCNYGIGDMDKWTLCDHYYFC